MSEIQVKNWNDLQDALFANSWNPDLRRYRSPYAFRGMPRSDMRLDTSLMRLGGDYVEKERHLLRNFRKYASHSYVENNTIWDWLSLRKHHGLPTRLLDWSFSPLVAQHFVTDDLEQYDRDGAIWQINYNEVHKYLPEELRSELIDEGSGVITVEMLSHTAQSLNELGRLSASVFPVFFEPPSMDDRIVNQYALFSMMSSPTAMFDDWLAKHRDLYNRVIIPAELKWEIRDKLDQANITDRVLFPGLDGLSSWLKRHYRTRKS